MNFWASLEYAVGVMIGSCSVIGVVGAKYRNHYAQIVMVGISALGTWGLVISITTRNQGQNYYDVSLQCYIFCKKL